MKKFLFLLLLACAPAFATITNFCDCGVGADAACVVGNDTNSGATTLAGVTGPKRTFGAVASTMATALAGDKINFCMGGSWIDATNGTTIPRTSTLAAYKANHLVFDSFSPTQFASSAQPILKAKVNLGTITVTGITKANPAVVTAANTLANGDNVYFGAVTGMPEINGASGQASVVSGTGFTVNINSSGFATAGTSGTAFAGCPYNDTTGTCTVFNFYPTGGSASTPYGGYTFQNLNFQGGDGMVTGGISMISSADSILIRNNTFGHLDSPFGCSNQASGGSPTNISIVNNSISYMLAHAGLFGCDNVLVDNNTFDHTANRVTVPQGAQTANDAKIRDHAIYISGNELDPTNPTNDTHGNVIRNNTFTNTGLNQLGDPNNCNTSIITGHGKIANWVIENNTFQQAAGTSGGGCYGIYIAPGNNNGSLEYEKGYTIRGNRVINTGSRGIRTMACQNCLIENNVVVQETAWDGFTGIELAQMPFAIVTNNLNVTVRNNSVYILGAIGAGGYCYSLGGSGTGHVLTNNLCIYGASGPGTVGNCFDMPLTSAGYAAWNNNLCFNFANWARDSALTLYSTKALFTAAFPGFDTAGVSANPLLVAVPASGNGWSMAIQTTSPAKNAGSAVAGRFAPRDYTTCLRDVTPDIGAYEFFAAACGTKPAGSQTGLR